jgi:YbgC/YbaW family acyl-CoA thioester hydrolase
MPPFRYPRRVQFAETDQAGIVHFSWYFRYMEEAEHALWRAAGLSIARADRPVVFPRVAAGFEYLAPLRFEEQFEVELRIAAIGRRSIRYVCAIVRDRTRIATGTMTVACAAGGRGEPLRGADIPENIARPLGRFLDDSGGDAATLGAPAPHARTSD